MSNRFEKLKKKLLERNLLREQSPLEAWVIQFLKPAKIYDYELEYQVDYYFLDIAFPQHKFGIELDGINFHSTEKQKNKDRNKDKYLKDKSWEILRISSYECWRPSMLLEKIDYIKFKTKNYKPYSEDLIKLIEAKNIQKQHKKEIDYYCCDRCGDMGLRIGIDNCKCGKWNFN